MTKARTPNITFTGKKSLEMLRRALELAISDLHTQMGSCPDVNEYAEDLEDLEAEREYFNEVIARINRKLEAVK
jgi:hypothetical protein